MAPPLIHRGYPQQQWAFCQYFLPVSQTIFRVELIEVAEGLVEAVSNPFDLPSPATD